MVAPYERYSPGFQQQELQLFGWRPQRVIRGQESLSTDHRVHTPEALSIAE
jgi:hypothetical protein